MPTAPISASMSASSSATSHGGEFGVTNNLLHEGDWIINTGAGGSTGTSKMALYIAAAAVGLFCIMKYKKML